MRMMAKPNYFRVFTILAAMAAGVVLTMLLLQGAGPALAQTSETIVDNADPSRFFINSNDPKWQKSTALPNAYGADKSYQSRQPTGGGYYAYFKTNIPTTGNYKVYAWYPADNANNSGTAYWIWTTSGWARKNVDQRTNGGQWVDLANQPNGVFKMPAGDDWDIEVDYGYYTKTKGNIIADAVRIVPAP
jgi:hypothetical protein